MATMSYRKNYISNILGPDGTIYSKHDQKAVIIWQSYKERLGQSTNATMMFDLTEIIQPHNLAHLDAQFTIDEIEQVVKEFPADRAPGPDGFNGQFLRKC